MGDKYAHLQKALIRHDNYFNASINLTTLFACATILHTCLLGLGKTEGE